MVNYMTQGSGGTVNVNVAALPSKGFIDAIKVRDIAKARILSGAEREGIVPGGPDVKLTKASGEIDMITRQELTKQYVHSSGKKITIAFLVNNKDYLVVRDCSEKYKILKLPNNCVGVFKGKQVKPGSYLVSKVDEQGNINMGTLGIVSPNIFKKMFKIPMQDVIKRNIGKKGKNFTLFTNNPLRRNSRPLHTNLGNNNSLISASTDNQGTSAFKPKPFSKIDTSKLGMNPKSFNIPTAEERRSKLNIAKVPEQNSSEYKYKALNAVVNMNDQKKPVGYTLIDLQTGKTAVFTIPQIAMMCEKRMIENIMIVRKENGTKYLKGNGIVLENLPKVLA